MGHCVKSPKTEKSGCSSDCKLKQGLAYIKFNIST